MIISFDLDNTLIPYTGNFESEKRNFFQKLFRAEKIRYGTIDLINNLKIQNHQIWIYTTSYRSIFSIWKTFKLYGIEVNKIINERINRAELNKNNCSASKNPILFGIDLHIDDSKGVEIEGERYNFRTLIVSPDNKNWKQEIINEIEH